MSAGQISLYLDLEDGQKADLETTARAAIAFSELIKEIAAAIDPLSQAKIEIIDGSEGSLSLNTIIRLFGAQDARKFTLRAVLVGAGLLLGNRALDFTLDKIAEMIWEQSIGSDDKKVSKESIKEISEEVVRALKSGVGEKPAQRIYHELEQDTAVRGVGVSEKPNTLPKFIVPRQEFKQRSGAVPASVPAPERRTRTEITRVVLISPVLIPGTRRWKFRSKEGEFGAPIKDEHFVNSVLSAQIPIIMKSNVEMTVELQTVDELRKGAWAPIERTVIRVLGVPSQFQGEQTLLPFDKK